jgi:hypothetical protein
MAAIVLIITDRLSFIKRAIDLAQYRDKLWKEIEACVSMVTGAEIGVAVGKLFGMVSPWLKTQVERQQVYQQALKTLRLPDADHPTPDFKTVYAIALVGCAAEVQDEKTWNLVNQLLKEDAIVTAFRSAFDRHDGQILEQAVAGELEALALGDEIRSAVMDWKPILELFTRQFLETAKRSQTPGEAMLSLQSAKETKQIQRSLAEMTQEMAQLAGVITKALPVGQAEELPQGSLLAQQMRSWFEVLNYDFEDYQHVDEKGFEWIIHIPNRRRYDRVLIRGVDGEAGVSDVMRFCWWRRCGLVHRRRRIGKMTIDFAV